jgi:hypothetical protein
VHSDARSLAALGLARDPIAHPLTYPGRLPPESGLLDGDRFLALRPGAADGRPLIGGEPLDDVLRRRGSPGLADRHPMLAVGSNGSPAQVRRKLVTGGADALVPMTYVTARGLVSGVSAHVSRPGYVPAAPVLAPGTTGRFVVLWLDEEQLAVVDATEPNYRRIPLPPEVTLDGPRPDVYAGRHGCLTDRHGTPFPLMAQDQLITALFADLPELARVTGADGPEEFAAKVSGDVALRERVRSLWRREKRVLDQAVFGPEELDPLAEHAGERTA